MLYRHLVLISIIIAISLKLIVHQHNLRQIYQGIQKQQLLQEHLEGEFGSLQKEKKELFSLDAIIKQRLGMLLPNEKTPISCTIKSIPLSS